MATVYFGARLREDKKLLCVHGNWNKLNMLYVLTRAGYTSIMGRGELCMSIKKQ
jgi:hypothetical protein